MPNAKSSIKLLKNVSSKSGKKKLTDKRDPKKSADRRTSELSSQRQKQYEQTKDSVKGKGHSAGNTKRITTDIQNKHKK